MKIIHIEVENFWQEKRISAPLDKSVNVIIGENGSGKTQFMDLIVAILTCNLKVLSQIEFKTATIKYNKSGSPRNKSNTLTVERDSDEMDRVARTRDNKRRVIKVQLPVITYYMNDKKYYLDLSMKDNYYGDVFDMEVQFVPAAFLRDQLAQIFRVVSLNVNRKNYEEEVSSDDYGRVPRKERINPLEDKIRSLQRRLSVERYNITNGIGNVVREGEKKLLSSLLFQHSSSDIKLIDSDIDDVKDNLLKTFDDIGFMDSDIQSSIDNMLDMVERHSGSNLEDYVESEDSKKNLSEFLFALDFMARARTASRISKETEENKKSISNKWDNYIKALSSFMKGKAFHFNDAGELCAQRGGKEIAIPLLSSGEKQIFVMLSEAFLESESNHIFFADEPELSLHLEWQANILPKMLELNANAQYILVTHSPEIAGNFPNNIRDMEEIYK